jgi:uncharacterized protein (DUF3084 family)
MTKNTLDRLASLGEEVIGKAAQNPATSRLLNSAMQLKDRVDDLTKRVRGLEAMEKRIDQLEKRVAKLESKPKATTKTSAAKKTDGV